MSVTLLAISPLASVRGPDCNERQSGKQGYPPPHSGEGGLETPESPRSDLWVLEPADGDPDRQA